MEPMVALIRSQEGMADRLLAEHVDNGHGRCSACPVGGQQGHLRWLCAIFSYARTAKDLVDTVRVHQRPVVPSPTRSRTEGSGELSDAPIPIMYGGPLP